RKPSKEITEFLGNYKNAIINKVKVQKDSKIPCCLFIVYFLYWRNKYNMRAIIEDIQSERYYIKYVVSEIDDLLYSVWCSESNLWRENYCKNPNSLEQLCAYTIQKQLLEVSPKNCQRGYHKFFKKKKMIRYSMTDYNCKIKGCGCCYTERL